jgi:hypothetical protein
MNESTISAPRNTGERKYLNGVWRPVANATIATTKTARTTKKFKYKGKKKKTCEWIGKRMSESTISAPRNTRERKYLNGVRRPVANAKTTSIELLTRLSTLSTRLRIELFQARHIFPIFHQT